METRKTKLLFHSLPVKPQNKWLTATQNESSMIKFFQISFEKNHHPHSVLEFCVTALQINVKRAPEMSTIFGL